jgi:hypothetical protein
MNKFFLGFQQARVVAGLSTSCKLANFTNKKNVGLLIYTCDDVQYIYSKVSLFIIFLLKDGPPKIKRDYMMSKKTFSIVKKWAHELEKRRRFHKSLIFHDR